MSVAVVGSVARDTIETPGRTQKDLLGGSATFFAAAARFFVDTRIIGAVGSDFRHGDERALREMNADTAFLERRRGRTYAWHGRYGADFANATTVERDVGVFDGYMPRLPAKPPDVDALFLGAISPALQKHVLESWPCVDLSGFDSREAWIREATSEVLALTSQVDVVFLNSFELAALTGCREAGAGARVLLRNGARTVVVKRGADGAELHSEGLELAIPACDTKVVDPTGAGDAFAGGFIGTMVGSGERNKTETLRRALRYGTALASIAVEGFGIETLVSVAPAELEARAAALEDR